MNKINVELDLNEANIIIKALAERPFREVYELIGKIHAQANTQLARHAIQSSKNKKNAQKRSNYHP